MINPMDLSGKKIIVTGASSGIGRETAIQVSKLGATVILIARNEKRLQETAQALSGTGHQYYCFDFQELEKIETLMKTIFQDFGKIDGLAHCAGFGDMYPIGMTTIARIQDQMNVNALAFTEMVRTLSKKKYRGEKLSIVGVSSVAGIKGENGLLAYSMSKAALNSAVMVMARELAKSNIRANAVVPAWIRTDYAERTIKEGSGSDKFERDIANRQHLGLGQPIDVANAIAFLLSDASRLITGVRLLVDGGYML